MFHFSEILAKRGPECLEYSHYTIQSLYTTSDCIYKVTSGNYSPKPFYYYFYSREHTQTHTPTRTLAHTQLEVTLLVADE